MKIWESNHTFDYTWETVVHAASRKYPNPINPVVKGIDVLERDITHNGLLKTRRLIKTEWDIPSWVTNLIGLKNPSYSHELSEIDPNTQKMTLQTINLNCTNFISVNERLTYTAHPDDCNKTLLEQSTEVSLYGLPLVDYLENLVVSAFRGNTAKGRQAMNWAIDNVVLEYDALELKLKAELQEMQDKVNQELNDLSNKVPRRRWSVWPLLARFGPQSQGQCRRKNSLQNDCHYLAKCFEPDFLS